MKKIGAIVCVLAMTVFTGCPFSDDAYQVRYLCMGNITGDLPVDPNTYYSGDRVTVLAPPENMKWGDVQFLGWSLDMTDEIYQPGDSVRVRYTDVLLYAQWEGVTSLPYTLNYKIDEAKNEATVTGYTLTIPYYGAVQIVILDVYQGIPVTRIGYGAFRGVNADKITLPVGLKEIDEDAFADSYLSSSRIAIPDTVTAIGIGAFRNCNFSKLPLPASLQTIGAYAFDSNSVTALTIPASVQTIGAGAFNRNYISTIEIGDNIVIESKSSLGWYGESFKAHYEGKGNRAGLYLYRDVWSGPLTEQP
jgi:hypothetical protein